MVGADFDFKNVERFLQPLLGIGIGTYKKKRLVDKIEKKNFWNKTKQKAIYDFKRNHILSDNYKTESNSILYIENVDDAMVSDEIEKELLKFSVNVIVDDAQEENAIVNYYVNFRNS